MREEVRPGEGRTRNDEERKWVKRMNMEEVVNLKSGKK